MLFLFATLQSYVVKAERSRDERGATAVEYGLLVGLIALAIIVAVGLLGTNIGAMFDRIGTRLTTIG